MFKKKNKLSSRRFLNLNTITDYSLKGYGQESVFYFVQPYNLSVMSEDSIASIIFALTNVLKGLAEVDIMCINSRDNFEQNKIFIKDRIQQEQNEVIRGLLEKDLIQLDKIQMQTATARLFMISIKITTNDQKEIYSLLIRIEKLLKIQNFNFHRASKDEIKNMLGVYWEQNVTTDKFENIEGERWYQDEKSI